MTLKAAQLLEAYTISGIDRKELNHVQTRFVDKIFILLIRKCNQEDKPLNSLTDALKEVAGAIKDDPLFEK